MNNAEIIFCLLIGLGHLEHSMHAAPSREAENSMFNDFNRINACLESLGAKPQEPPKRQFQEKLGSSSPAD